LAVRARVRKREIERGDGIVTALHGDEYMKQQPTFTQFVPSKYHLACGVEHLIVCVADIRKPVYAMVWTENAINEMRGEENLCCGSI
jgi:hypothetical protein